MNLRKYLILSCIATVNPTWADITVPMSIVSPKEKSKPVGNIVISETKYGLLFTPYLHNLQPGVHGFHIHQNPSCADNGMAAGSHLDPKNTSKHLGPYGNGHLGDLPALYINADGTANSPVLAPRLHHLSEVNHRSLMLHDNGDNYSDAPQKLGGGGGRMVCGVIP